MVVRREFIKNTFLGGMGLAIGNRNERSILSGSIVGKRIGLIGLDSSHSVEFTKTLNNCTDNRFEGFKVVAAYPYGSRLIESSFSRIDGYTHQVKALDVSIKSSLEAVLDVCDAVLLETNDGSLHYEQAMAVMRAGKPLFIDKPLAANYGDVKRIFSLSESYSVPFFTASSLRYVDNLASIRNGELCGRVLGAQTFSPCPYEPSHVDFYWYGIHGVELLYGAMGTGCIKVQCLHTDKMDVVTGIWNDGRIGIVRGTRTGHDGYGGIVFGESNTVDISPYSGYDSLLVKIVQFFKTGKSPVDVSEMKEVYAFMTAAANSSSSNGNWIDLSS